VKEKTTSEKLEGLKEMELNCRLEENGTLYCKIPGETFDKIREVGVKPKKLVFEIDDSEEEETPKKK